MYQRGEEARGDGFTAAKLRWDGVMVIGRSRKEAKCERDRRAIGAGKGLDKTRWRVDGGRSQGSNARERQDPPDNPLTTKCTGHSAAGRVARPARKVEMAGQDWASFSALG